MIFYINNGAKDSVPYTGVTGVINFRSSDPITSIYIFSHVRPGCIALGYGHNNASSLEFSTEMIGSIHEGVFSSDAYFWLFSCRPGSTEDGNVSFAQALANHTGINVKATFSGFGAAGRTTYTNILGITENRMIQVKLLGDPGQISRAVSLRRATIKYENERADSGWIEGTPYPALQYPVPAASQFFVLADTKTKLTDYNSRWITYTPEKVT